MMPSEQLRERARLLRMNIVGVVGLIVAVAVAFILFVVVVGWLISTSASNQPPDEDTHLEGQ